MKPIKKALLTAGLIVCIVLLKLMLPVSAGQFPETITQEEFLEIQKKADTCFNFVSNNGILTLRYEKGKASVAYEHYGTLDNLLTSEEQKLFSKTTKIVDHENVDVYFLHHGDLEPQSLQDKPSTAKPNSEEYWKSYLFAKKRRIFDKAQNPQPMDAQDLPEYLQKNKVLFYTGAGISISGGVWGMDALCNALELDFKKFKKDPKEFLKILINKKEQIYATFKKFCQMMFYNPPTKAHRALASIAKKLKAPILTENLDYLHEQTGIKPHRLYDVEKSKKLFPGKFLKTVNAVVCIGLSFDDKAFMTLYKQQNPNGKIISLDLKQPNYLGSEDLFVKGDLQEIMVSIDKNI